MKRIICFFLSAVLILGSVPVMDTAALTEGSFNYEVTDGEAIITAYRGFGTSVTVPSHLGDYPVTGIGSSAFQNKTALRTVILPESVKTIGEDAFYSCYNLSTITFGEGLESIGAQAFYSCNNLTDIHFPKSLTYLDPTAFCYSVSLANVTVAEGNSVYHATNNCLIETATGTVVLGGKNAVIPNDGSIKAFGDYAFSSHSPSKLSIPASVTSIGDYAFFNCTTLVEVTFPETLLSVGRDAFYGTKWRSNHADGLIFAGKLLLGYKGTYPADLVVPEGTLGIADYAFNSCHNLTSVSFPDTLQEIGEYAFWNCSSLTAVTIPGSVTTVNNDTFRMCSSLQTLVLEEGVTTLEDYAFQACELSCITLPMSLAHVGDDALDLRTDCELYYPGSLEDLINLGLTPRYVQPNGNWHIDQCRHIYDSQDSASCQFCGHVREFLTEGDYTYSVEKSKAYIASYSGSAANLVVPDTLGGYPVAGIDSHAFSFCNALVTIRLPEGLTFIGNDTFYFCTNLTTVEFPETVEYIGDSAFSQCSQLLSFHLPFNLTYLGTFAFHGCKQSQLHLPKGIRFVGTCVFSGADNLYAITIGGENPYYAVKGYCLIERATGTLLQGCRNSVIPNDGSITAIASYAFANNSIEKIVIPEGVTTIGNAAFQNCQILKDLTLPSTLQSIGSDAFNNCSSLSELTLPQGLICIESNAFSGCSIKDLVLPDSLTDLQMWAFANNAQLQSLHIGSTLEYVGYGCFENCTALTDVWYTGTRAQRDAIVFDSNNEPLLNATWHYETCPGEHTYTDKNDAQCDKCDFVRVLYTSGDMNDDGIITDSDAIYLLRHILFPNVYTLNQPADVNNDGIISDADALYLLRHVLFPNVYPLS